MKRSEYIRQRKKVLKARITKAVTILFVFSLLSTGAFLYFFKSADYIHFTYICRSIRKGDTLESVRTLAANWGYLFEPDPDPAGNSSDAIFILRPNRDWSTRFSCKIAASHGIVK